ncbi:MAG TPA: MFS transporter, partial [Ktedonobacteraceae bacterium]|nr:MFS transporter [Ktedonobacteraceae bacterium]
ADRWNRRVLLIGIDVARGVFVGLLPLLIWIQGLQVWFLVAIILVVDLLGTLFDPALQVSLPILARDSKTLYNLNGVMDTTSRFARVMGPGLTGLLLLFLPFVHFFTLDAVSFGVSALALCLLGTRLTSGSRRGSPESNQFPLSQEQERQHQYVLLDFLHDIGTGYALALKHRAFFWAILSLGIINMAWSVAYTIGVPLWTQHILHSNPALLGVMFSAYGLGNVVSLFLGTLGKRWPLMSMYVGKILQGGGFVMLALTSSSLLAIGSMFLSAVGGALGDLTLATMIQTDFPLEHVGKIYSLRRTIGNLGLTLGSLSASLVYLIFPVSTGIMGSGMLIVFVGVTCLFRFRAQ